MTPAPNLQEMIDAVRADAPSDRPLDRLSQASLTAAELAEVGDALLGHFVDQCRRQGHSWSEISAALGVTKQAAHKRFSAGAPTFERFSPRARAVLQGAATEARELGSGFIGTGHLLLGLYRQEMGLAARILTEAGVGKEACRQQLAAALTRANGPGDAEGSDRGQLPYTPEAIEVLRGAGEEALRLGHNYIGTEHLLLALFRDPEDPAAQALAALGASADDTKRRLKDIFARL